MRTEQIVFNPHRQVGMRGLLFDPPVPELGGELFGAAKRPALIICPGGGYVGLSPREADPALLAFTSEGYQAFVLSYSVGDHSTYPNPLIDVSRAVRWVRMNAERLRVDPTKVAALGFSAGGHAVASLGTQHHLDHWKKAEAAEYRKLTAAGWSANDRLLEFDNRPDAMLLAYPLLDVRPEMDDIPQNIGQMQLGKLILDQDPLACPVDFISPETVPTFLWQTAWDATVPSIQGTEFVWRLLKAGVEVEYHLYGAGEHGLSTADSLADYPPSVKAPVNVPSWVELALAWLDDRFAR